MAVHHRYLGSSPRAAVALLWMLCSCTSDDPAREEADVTIEPARARDPYAHTASRFGVVEIHAGFTPDPKVVGGVSSGEVPASSIHRKCRGWISEAPDYLLSAKTAILELSVMARSQRDVLLVMRTPQGEVLCNDNRPGTRDPSIRMPLSIGTSQVWVGVQERGEVAIYRLGFSELKSQPATIPLPED